eukprot:Nk52_evm4s77 gene=Nk52_evmTU4s77
MKAASHMQKLIELFKGHRGAYCVVGASTDKRKFGNRVLCHYKGILGESKCVREGCEGDSLYKVQQVPHPKLVGVNPRESVIEGVACFKKVSDIPLEVLTGRDNKERRATVALSVVTPPKVTLQLFEELERLLLAPQEERVSCSGVDVVVWLQPGSEDQGVVEKAEKLEEGNGKSHSGGNTLGVIQGGPCVLQHMWEQQQ